MRHATSLDYRYLCRPTHNRVPRWLLRIWAWL
jgi:hypothetical protein